MKLPKTVIDQTYQSQELITQCYTVTRDKELSYDYLFIRMLFGP